MPTVFTSTNVATRSYTVKARSRTPVSGAGAGVARGPAVAGLRQCMKDLSLKHGWVVSTATERRTIGANIEVIPWDAVVRGEVDLEG